MKRDRDKGGISVEKALEVSEFMVNALEAKPFPQPLSLDELRDILKLRKVNDPKTAESFIEISTAISKRDLGGDKSLIEASFYFQGQKLFPDLFPPIENL